MRALLLSIVVAASALAPDDPPPGMVLVPGGEFVMGRDDGAFDEAPAHRVEVSAFWIDRTEVTNAQFAAFVRATASFDAREGPWFRASLEGCLDVIAFYEARYGARLAEFELPAHEDPAERLRVRNDAARWRAADAAVRTMLQDTDASPDVPLALLALHPAVRDLVRAQANLPVRFVAWRDAAAFAKWADKRLPTEAEWEKAARGTDGRAWPWGDEWSGARCRSGLAPALSPIFDPYRTPRTTAPSGPTLVGHHPEGASPHGCLDMAGNVWEWCADWYGELYYAEGEGAVDPTGPPGLADGRLPAPRSETELLRDPRQGRATDSRKVLRGGGWCGPPNRASFDTRTTRRLWSNPTYWHADVGFRCVKDVPD